MARRVGGECRKTVGENVTATDASHVAERNAMRYYWGAVIRSFADKDTESVWKRVSLRRWSAEVQRSAYRKLLIIDAAEAMADLNIPPGNRLEKLAGDRAGQYSIRVNKQWRVCFKWRDGNADEVEITDYH